MDLLVLIHAKYADFTNQWRKQIYGPTGTFQDTVVQLLARFTTTNRRQPFATSQYVALWLILLVLPRIPRKPENQELSQRIQASGKKQKQNKQICHFISQLPSIPVVFEQEESSMEITCSPTFSWVYPFTKASSYYYRPSGDNAIVLNHFPNYLIKEGIKSIT